MKMGITCNFELTSAIWVKMRRPTHHMMVESNVPNFLKAYIWDQYNEACSIGCLVIEYSIMGRSFVLWQFLLFRFSFFFKRLGIITSEIL